MDLLQIGFKLLALLLSGVSLFLSVWIVLPAPTFALLPLGVGAPEISPGLLGLNAIAALIGVIGIRRSAFYGIVLSLSLIGLGLSALPLWQFPAAEQRATSAMHTALGANYLATVPDRLQAQMRPHPFVLTDWLRGIPTSPVRHTSGIQFAAPDGVPLTLEIYRPVDVGKYPTIVTLYGGAWRSGSPALNTDFNRYMAARGYTVIAIDYRHAPQYRFPAQLDDVKTALAFIQQHAADYEVNLERVALLGRSAGAHLALLAAYQTSALPIRAVVSYYGPIDLTAGYNDPPVPDPIQSRPVLEAFLGGSPTEHPKRYQQASPIHAVTRSLPPTLLVYGDRDHVVQAKFGRELYERLRSLENTAVLIEIPWAEHAFDAVFRGVSNQLALYYTERFLAWALYRQNS